MISYYKRQPLIAVTLTLMAAILCVWPMWIYSHDTKSTDVAKLGQLGDSYNILATLVNIITVIFLGMTLSEQRKAYKKQEDELIEQRKILSSQNDVMTKQLKEMEKSRSLESARVLHGQIFQFLSAFKYNGGFKNSGSIYSTSLIGYTGFENMKKELNGSTIGNIENLDNNRKYISQIRPIVQLIKAFVDISHDDTAQYLMLHAIIPDGFRQICLNLTGPDTDNAAYNDFMRHQDIRAFRELVRSIPEFAWN